MFVYGDQGNLNVSFLNFEKFYTSRNFKGKQVAFPIGSEPKNIVFNTSFSTHIFCFQIIYNMKNKGIEEIKSGATLSQFVNEGHFPLYYYLKIKNENYIDIDVNLRLNSYNESLLQNNFGIKGYMLNEDSIKRKINGEYILLDNPIIGYYSDIFKVGLLQVNQKLKENFNYLLIEIISNKQLDINAYLLVELATKEYNEKEYFIPINQYLIETFDGENKTIREENKYYLSSDLKLGDQAFIELSSGFDDVKIEFDESYNIYAEFDYFKGFKKYRVYNDTKNDVYFSVVNPKHRKASYMIRYFFTGKGGEYVYDLNLKPQRNIISSNGENVNINLIFDGIQITRGSKIINRSDIYFYIYGLLYKMKENSEEKLNTTCPLIEQIPSFEAKTRHNYNRNHTEKWSLIFENIPREKNYIYGLQLQVNAILENNIFNEEFLIFTTKVDLTDIGKEKNDLPNIFIIIGSVVGFLILLFILFLIYKYCRERMKNEDLEEEIKSIVFSNDIQKKVNIKEKNISKRDSDYESTFI